MTVNREAENLTRTIRNNVPLEKNQGINPQQYTEGSAEKSSEGISLNFAKRE